MKKKYCEIDKNGYFVKVKNITSSDNIYSWMKDLDKNGGRAAEGYNHTINDLKKNKPSDCILAIPPQHTDIYNVKWKNNKWIYEEKDEVNIPSDMLVDSSREKPNL